MDYTTQTVIDIVPHTMKHVFAIYDGEDTYCENPIYPVTDWNAHEKSNYNPNYRESKSIKGYRIVYHDIDKLPNDINNYRNLTFTIEGKTCALVKFTDKDKNELYQETGNYCILPDSVKLCEFVDSRIFEDDINFESKDDFQSILNDWFSYEYDRQNELKRKLHEVSTPTPPLPAEVKGYDLKLDDTQLKTLHGKLIERTFLDADTKIEHSKNAFNGKVLAADFEQLKWVSGTKGAIFISYFLRKETKGLWKLTRHLLESANYSRLLSQSKGNETFESTTVELKDIERIIKNITS